MNVKTLVKSNKVFNYMYVHFVEIINDYTSNIRDLIIFDIIRNFFIVDIFIRFFIRLFNYRLRRYVRFIRLF